MARKNRTRKEKTEAVPGAASDFANEASDGKNDLSKAQARPAEDGFPRNVVVINDDGARVDRLTKRDARISFAEQVAAGGQSTAGINAERYCLRNFRWGGADLDFPKQPGLRTVEKYFPHAIGGPLMIDYAANRQEAKALEQKADVLRKKGFRYLIQIDRMELIDAFIQLGEVKIDDVGHTEGRPSQVSI